MGILESFETLKPLIRGGEIAYMAFEVHIHILIHMKMLQIWY